MDRKKVTVSKVIQMKKKGKKIVMLTAYDYIMSSLFNESNVDIILVGDSVGNTVLGYKNTIPVTLEDIIHHTAAVVRGNHYSLVVADMPFMTYKINSEQALKNAGRLIQEAGAEAVKMEGGIEIKKTIQRIVEAGIPVMGHIGFTPQSIHKFGGYKVQGKDNKTHDYLIESAKAIEDAGAFSLVLELVPTDVAKEITDEISIPTIGIGAGPYCDGQVLVIYDMLGMVRGFKPKFLKTYANLADEIVEAINRFSEEVRKGIFPDNEHYY